MTIQGASGRRQYWAGDVAFVQEPGIIRYWPAKSARILQCVAAVGIALVSLFLAVLIWRAHPLSGLIDEGDALNSIAAVFLFTFAGLLLLAVPIYLRGAKTPYILERGSTTLRHGRRNATDIQGATGVTIVTRRVGEGGDITVYSVALSRAKEPISLPLLTFDQQEEAQHIAVNISALLALPLV